MEKFNQERENNILIVGTKNTRAKAKAEEAANEDMLKTKLRPKQTILDYSNVVVTKTNILFGKYKIFVFNKRRQSFILIILFYRNRPSSNNTLI